MIASCKICKNGTCAIQVKGLERDADQYLDQPQVSIRNYTFEHTVTVNVLHSIDSKENMVMDQFSIVPHTDIDIDNITIEKDGLKQIDHYIVPNEEWIDYVIQMDPTSLDNYSLVYYFNKQDESFYKYHQGSSVKVEPKEVFEVNTDTTTLIKTSVNTFQICHLEECFFKICLYLLENMPCTDPCFNDKMKGFAGEILNRDIIWMAINVIKYCLQLGQYHRAQTILEQIETCWGICKQLNKNNSSNYSGCGCS